MMNNHNYNPFTQKLHNWIAISKRFYFSKELYNRLQNFTCIHTSINSKSILKERLLSNPILHHYKVNIRPICIEPQ